MATSKVPEWVMSPYCFCKDLPWLVLRGLPATPPLLAGALGWEDMAILAAFLIGLAVFLFLLFLLLCLLCPGGVCCGPSALCCRKKQEKSPKASAMTSAMSLGSSTEDTTLTAVDLKLPRAWMDTSKSGVFESSDVVQDADQFDGSKVLANTDDLLYGRHGYSTKIGRRQGHAGSSRTSYDDDWVYTRSGAISTRSNAHRARSASVGSEAEFARHWNIRSAHSADVDGGWSHGGGDRTARTESLQREKLRSGNGVVHEMTRDMERWSRSEGQRAWKSRQGTEVERNLGKGPDTSRTPVYDLMTSKHTSQSETSASLQQQQAMMSSSNALEQTTQLTSASGEIARTEQATSGTPVVQCYTVTKKTTTTTYGDEEGDEETCVVTTTEKKWRDGMNEVGEISVSASATAGEILPSLGAPAHVMADVSNVRTVKSLTNVEGSRSDVVRRYEFQQSRVRDTAL